MYDFLFWAIVFVVVVLFIFGVSLDGEVTVGILGVPR